jgi:hypothetical protein
MCLESLLDRLFDAGRASVYIDNRTKDSVTTHIIRELANDRRISGKQNYTEALSALIGRRHTDADFATALNTVADTVLGMFPVSSNPSVED